MSDTSAAERLQREERLRDPMGWLGVVGLHWLKPGTWTFGSDPDGDIVLEAADGAVPWLAGTLEVASASVRLHPAPDVPLTFDGRPVPDGLELADDDAEEPTILALASLRLVLIRRGPDRIGLRVRDTAAPAIDAFGGLQYFDIDSRWRITGRLVSGGPGSTIPITDVLGSINEEATPGVVVFEVDGRAWSLHALEMAPGHLWLMFQDGTSGHETYGGGRYLVSGELAADGSVEIDFNLAYNPPCVFTPFATCPLPPLANRLPFRVDAGERLWTPET